MSSRFCSKFSILFDTLLTDMLQFIRVVMDKQCYQAPYMTLKVDTCRYTAVSDLAGFYVEGASCRTDIIKGEHLDLDHCFPKLFQKVSSNIDACQDLLDKDDIDACKNNIISIYDIDGNLINSGLFLVVSVSSNDADKKLFINVTSTSLNGICSDRVSHLNGRFSWNDSNADNLELYKKHRDNGEICDYYGTDNIPKLGKKFIDDILYGCDKESLNLILNDCRVFLSYITQVYELRRCGSILILYDKILNLIDLLDCAKYQDTDYFKKSAVDVFFGEKNKKNLNSWSLPRVASKFHDLMTTEKYVNTLSTYDWDFITSEETDASILNSVKLEECFDNTIKNVLSIEISDLSRIVSDFNCRYKEITNAHKIVWDKSSVLGQIIKDKKCYILNALRDHFLHMLKVCHSLSELKNIEDAYKSKNEIMPYIQSIKGIFFKERKNATIAEWQISAELLSKSIKELELLRLEIQSKEEELKNQESLQKILKDRKDLTLPARVNLRNSFGRHHPISVCIEELKKIMSGFGFSVAEGPEIEDEAHVFDLLNTPKFHPARASSDTFHLKPEGILLRTHTSSVQIRMMEKHGAPLKIISIGRVYRNDWDSTHSPMFHQMEGLCVDKFINLCDMKFCITHMLKEYLGDLEFRFRSSYFPFTEPSFEVDVKMPGNGKWLEVLGCGLVHKSVLSNVGINLKDFSGFAFGVGIERLAMLKGGVRDLRDLYEGDISFLLNEGEPLCF